MLEFSRHRKLLFCLLLVAIASSTTPASAQTVDIRTVALTGDPAPGTVGATFQDFLYDNGPALNNLGHVAFSAIVTGGATRAWEGNSGPEVGGRTGAVGPRLS